MPYTEFGAGGTGHWQKRYLVRTPTVAFNTKIIFRKVLFISKSADRSYLDHWRTEVIVALEISQNYRCLGLWALTILGKVCFPVSCFRLPTNQYIDVVFDDVDEAELALDTIADGQLYRVRRAAQSGLKGQGDSSQGGHWPSRADLSQRLGRGTPRPSGGNQRGNNGGHAPSQDKRSNRLNISVNSTARVSSFPKG